MAKRAMPDKKVVVKEILFMNPNSELEPEQETNEPIRLTVINCNRLNVRDGPNRERKILFVIPEGTVVIVEQMTTFDSTFNGDWLYISLEQDPKQKGYVLAQYVGEV